ncbi:serine/threonine-protein kinase M1 [Arachnomyces sp. PD_36]|nr:serine/threonine-protein kinase M1 [Arachnomyces sp. PD_36]
MAGDDVGNARRPRAGNGFHNKQHGEPAPASSILAAQLASTQIGQEHELNRGTFSQLRQELLGNGEGGQFNLDGNVTDVHNLISVVMKAGLEDGGNDNPFNPRGEAEGQTLDCLDIIRLAIQKTPQALYEISDPELLGKPGIYAPLYVWLTLHLLSLLRVWSQDDIRESIHGLFPTIVGAQFKSKRRWHSDRSISSFYQACIEDIQSSFEEIDYSSQQGVSGFKLSFPGSRETFATALENVNLSGSIAESNIKLGTPLKTAESLRHLLNAVASPLPLDSLPKTGSADLRNNLGWALNYYQRHWKVLLGWGVCDSTSTEGLISLTRLIVECLASIRICYTFTSRLCQDTSLNQQAVCSWIQFGAELLASVKLSSIPDIQHVLCQQLNESVQIAQTVPEVTMFIEETYLPLLIDISKDEARLQSFNPSLQQAIERILNREYRLTRSTSHTELRPSRSRNGSKSGSKSGSVIASPRISNALSPGEEPIPDGRAHKRLRLSQSGIDVPISGLSQTLTTEVCQLLGHPNSSGLNGLSLVASDSFSILSQNVQCEFLTKLGRVACAGDSTLSVEQLGDPFGTEYRCSICDDTETENKQRLWKNSHFEELRKVATEIVPHLQRSAKPRVAGMIALRHILMHDPNGENVRLTSSPFGEWCLHSLRSSIRELRVVSGQTLMVFVRKTLPTDIRRSNFVVALEYLRSLFEKHESPVQETCVITLCHLAEISGDEEMNIILLRLLEYLGHSNPYISGIAYTGLSKLAQNSGTTPGALFRPFWRTLSVSVAKNLQNRPHMAEHLCDLLGMKVDDFLRLTEMHTLPYLVLMRKRDIILRIGSTHNPPMTPFQLCTEKDNLAAILALLLIQSSTDHQGMIVSLLVEVSEEFKTHDAASLIRVEPILIACDLLKGLGDCGEGKEAKFHQAFRILSSLTPRRPGLSKKTDLVANFIEEHVLGIITQFAHTVNDFQIRQPMVEKKRNIMAIGEMIKLAKGHIRSALPQICACLRSAFDIPELCDYAFTAWSILMTSLSADEIEPLIDQTLSIIIKNWDSFQTETRDRAYGLVGYIINDHRELVDDIFHTMPSLASIPLMAEYESELGKLKEQMDDRTVFLAFSRRCQSDNAAVVEQTLKELVPQLYKHEQFLHRSVVNEQPDAVVAQLTRSLLDCCVKFSATSDDITTLTAQCLGLIGCLDPNRIETVKEKKDILVLSNFHRAEETLDFILFFLQNVLVEAFLSASNTRAQGFLAYAMQSLLRFCNLESAISFRDQDSQSNDNFKRWLALPELVRNTLTPFLTSRYTVTIGAVSTSCDYPLFSPDLSHAEWLRTFVLDLLQKGNGDNLQMIFSVSSRIIRNQDISIASFLLPFTVLNLAVAGTEGQKKELQEELTRVLEHPLPQGNHQARDNILLCSESVFDVLDYLSRWLQGKKKQLTSVATQNAHSRRSHYENLMEGYSAQIKSVEQLLSTIPAEVISKRAVECKSFSRALFYWEQYIRQRRVQATESDSGSLEPLYQRLQDIYTQIDEPDGIEGISAHLHVLNVDQQVLEHRKAGRWVAAQSWYELQLNKTPDDSEIQQNLLLCLRESGQHDVLLNQFRGLKTTESSRPRLLPFVAEASWVTGKWDKLDECLKMCSDEVSGDFNIGIGSALCALHQRRNGLFKKIVNDLRRNIVKGFTANSIASLQACHGSVLQLHVLTEVESIADVSSSGYDNRASLLEALDRRLGILGGYLSDKQYLLGLRRATMELSPAFDDSDIAAVWLTGARLARKANSTSQAFDAVLHAAQLKDKSATIEHARLLWKEGNHRKAIQTLEGAIAANAFVSHDYSAAAEASVSVAPDRQQQQNALNARAYLLLAKWMDRAGQTQSEVIVQRYREAISYQTRWEKAHYYLGKHYNKILDSEKAKPLGKEAQIYLSGEASKLVIDNYLRSLAHGNKYVYQTLPKVLTLWLEHAQMVDQPFDPKHGDNEKFQKHSINQRKKSLDDMHSQLKKYINRMPAALLYTILAQVVARLGHTNQTVYNILTQIVVKTVIAFPQQGLWTILAVVKSSSKDRASRGISCIQKITETTKKMKADSTGSEMRSIINQAQKLADELLKVSDARIEDRVSKVSLEKNLRFNHRTAPCRLVVPLEATLTPSLPATHETGYLKTFRAFPRDTVTVETVLDEALVLNSLQKPRKISIRGSDGKIYSLLCKPKDDLRKDQRLMEFNTTINRFLKRDVESSKRRLYIKTYAVTPLNEECGLIEWVDNLRTLREIVVKLLRERGIMPNYNQIRHQLNDACANPANLSVFHTEILAKYPSVLHDCLGDRHGENILFEEGSGGVLHVDFNCLFDKGLTFDKPELVPFRLTHNMVDAFGAYGYNGPFRKTCELTLGLLRQNEDALMTVLETFLHDPTTDFIGKKKRNNPNVPDTPQGVLEFVRNKLRGLLPGESVPLSVGGHVDELILQATATRNLAAMYIGWCAFF